MRGEIHPKNEEEEMIFKLQRFLGYIENCVEQPINFNGHTQVCDIVDWRERINRARERYPDIKPEEFEVELTMTGRFEEELRALIEKIHSITFKANEPLWAFLRSEIMNDINRGSLPEIPGN